MSKLLWLTLAIMTIASVASADVIGVYNDANGVNCNFAPGFNPYGTVIHWSSVGSVGANFKIVLPAGSTLFSFLTNFPGPVPISEGNISVAYSGCLAGQIVVGTIVAILAPGTIQVLPIDGGIGYVESTKCDLTSRYVYPSNGGVGQAGGCNTYVSVEASTWGRVKSLYR